MELEPPLKIDSANFLSGIINGALGRLRQNLNRLYLSCRNDPAPVKILDNPGPARTLYNTGRMMKRFGWPARYHECNLTTS